MGKYTERLVQKIVRLIEQDDYTISEICDAMKINRDTFYEWKKTKPEFRKAIEAAEERRDDTLATLARKSMRDQLEGYIEMTEKIVYEDDGWGGEKIKSRVVTKKKHAPKANVLKLAMERQDNRREKEELRNTSTQSTPIVIKFAKDINQIEALQTMIDFKKTVCEVRTDYQPEPEEDDENYTTVVI